MASAALSPPRRTQAERSEAMRARLSAAAYEMVIEGGLEGLRMKAVAAAAGVSQGALLHHFPDKPALTLAAIDHALGLARVDGDAHLARSPREPAALLAAMLAEFRQFFFSDRFWVGLGITMEAGRQPELRPRIRELVAELRNPIYAGWAERLAAAGWTSADAAREVRTAAALVSGAAIRKFWTDPDALTGEIEAQWLAGALARRGSKARSPKL